MCYKVPPPTSLFSRFTVRVIVAMNTLYLRRRAASQDLHSFLLNRLPGYIAVVLFSLTNQIFIRSEIDQSGIGVREIVYFID